MPINETAVGNDSVAITGTASAGERTVGVKGIGDSVGVRGEGRGWHGVEGISNSTIGGHGVFGANTAGGTGVVGTSTGWIGVYGETTAPANVGAAAMWGDGKGSGDGVKGIANGPGKSAVCGFHLGNSGPGVFGQGVPAGHFQGDVVVTGDIQLTNADCAEDFDICEEQLVESGTVMVLGEEGKLQQSQDAYDKRVAGVVSGAGDYKPGIVLDKQQSQSGRRPIALLGKVFCKVDAQYGAIEVGDLLTTAPTPGHAMKVTDPMKAFGAVIGKALRPLEQGPGLIPILIALQ